MKVRLFVLGILLLCSVVKAFAQLPYKFSDGNIASADEINSNFEFLADGGFKFPDYLGPSVGSWSYEDNQHFQQLLGSAHPVVGLIGTSNFLFNTSKIVQFYSELATEVDCRKDGRALHKKMLADSNKINVGYKIYGACVIIEDLFFGFSGRTVVIGGIDDTAKLITTLNEVFNYNDNYPYGPVVARNRLELINLEVTTTVPSGQWGLASWEHAVLIAKNVRVTGFKTSIMIGSKSLAYLENIHTDGEIQINSGAQAFVSDIYASDFIVRDATAIIWSLEDSDYRTIRANEIRVDNGKILEDFDRSRQSNLSGMIEANSIYITNGVVRVNNLKVWRDTPDPYSSNFSLYQNSFFQAPEGASAMFINSSLLVEDGSRLSFDSGADINNTRFSVTNSSLRVLFQSAATLPALSFDTVNVESQSILRSKSDPSINLNEISMGCKIGSHIIVDNNVVCGN